MTSQQFSPSQQGIPDSISHMVIRPIEMKDLDAYMQFAFVATSGITNLPKEKKLLVDKIKRSEEAFAKKKDPEIGFDGYIFVLEDTKTGELGGTCAIKARTGRKGPLYFYKIETDTTKGVEIRYLRPVKYESAPTEVCALFIMPEYRKSNLGRLLSLSRFLFIANFPDRFDENIFAEMRGTIDKTHVAPFWNGLGRHFYNVEFNKIIEMQGSSRNFIPEILPKYPIYITFLPREAQDAIGVVHPDTKPALAMLELEGFEFTNEIDLFDGGPRIAAKTNKIRTIKKSQVAVIEVEDVYQQSEMMLISNTSLNFRCTTGRIEIKNPDHVLISPDLAQVLQVKKGDKVRYVPLR